MGLKKSFETASGVTGDYWKVLNSVLMSEPGHDGGSVRGDIFLYISKIKRDENKACIHFVHFELPYTDAMFASSSDAEEVAYKAIKVSSDFMSGFFLDAEDE